MAKRDDLEAIGLKAWHAYRGEGGSRYGSEALIAAFAAIVAAAPAAGKRKPKTDGTKLPFSPQALHGALRDRVGHIVSCEVVAGWVFGALGKRLASTPGLEAADLERVVSWIEAHEFKGLMVHPTFQMVANNIDKYINLAREWDKRGRQAVKGGNVGSAETAQFDWKVFK